MTGQHEPLRKPEMKSGAPEGRTLYTLGHRYCMLSRTYSVQQ